MATLVAPAACHEALFSLLAFNHHISTIEGHVSEPVLAEIRLQWWRDSVRDLYAGSPPDHPVLISLAKAISDYGLPESLFEDYLLAWTFIDPSIAPEQMEARATATGGALNELMAVVLGLDGVADEQRRHARSAVRHAGAAWVLSHNPGNDQERAVMARHHIAAARQRMAHVPKQMQSVMLSAFLAEERLRRGDSVHPGTGYLFRFYWKVLRRSF